MNTIAERIKFAMKAKNKKQVDIVKDTGISKGAFSSYLSGQYNPKADKMELIADSLDVDLRWLYGENVPMEHTSKNNNALQYVFYNNSCSEYLLDNLDDIYCHDDPVCLPHSTLLCPCQSRWKCNAHTALIFERG